MKDIKIVRIAYGFCGFGHMVEARDGKLPEKCDCGFDCNPEIFKVPLPERQHSFDAGFDLCSASDHCTITSEKVTAVPLGIKIQLPEEEDFIWEAQIRPRSGLAKKGLMIINSPGTIDSGYRGQLMALCLMAPGMEEINIKRGDRICQLVITKIPKTRFVEVGELDSSDRGAGGFGSTGI